MNPTIEISFKTAQAYSAMCKPLCQELKLPQTAFDILMFLANNPDCTTARDIVEIRKINEHTLIGTSPDITRYFIELRGIGIIDVKTLFGVEGVKEKQQIDLVIKLEDWKKDNEYDRLGLEEEYTEFLGNKVVCHSLPIRAGRNLAVICEAAAVNHRQKKMGYNAAQELYRRVQENLTKKSDDEEDE